MKKDLFDFIVIGGGPGGYIAAIRAASNGKKVALIEKGDLGGTCLNRGCIPSKALIHKAHLWHQLHHLDSEGIEVKKPSFSFEKMAAGKDKVVNRMRKGLEGLVAANKIHVFKGEGKLVDAETVKVLGDNPALLSAPTIILATGSEPKNIAAFPFDDQQILSSTSLLARTELPKSIAIIGGGVIGCEFASMYHDLGVKVTVIEALDHLIPMEAVDLSKALRTSFEKRGITVLTGAMVEGIDKSKKGVSVRLSNKEKIEAEVALVAVGRSMNVKEVGLDKAGVLLDQRGFIEVNEHMQTNISNIYAIGDITGKWLLAHVASHQGIVAVDHALGKRSHMHYHAIPSVTFTRPEVASVGMSYEEALEKGIPAEKGAFPFQALGKSQATSETEGFAQVILDKETGQILGAQVMGDQASVLIAEMTIAINNELTDACLAETVHAHPTLSEAWLESTLEAMGSGLHLPPKRGKR